MKETCAYCLKPIGVGCATYFIDDDGTTYVLHRKYCVDKFAVSFIKRQRLEDAVRDWLARGSFNGW